MNGWQIGLQQLSAPPVPLQQRTPMNETTGRKVEREVEQDDDPVDAFNRTPVSMDELAMFRALSAQGWSSARISRATGRSKKSVLRYLKGERTPRE